MPPSSRDGLISPNSTHREDSTLLFCWPSTQLTMGGVAIESRCGGKRKNWRRLKGQIFFLYFVSCILIANGLIGHAGTVCILVRVQLNGVDRSGGIVRERSDAEEAAGLALFWSCQH